METMLVRPWQLDALESKNLSGSLRSTSVAFGPQVDAKRQPGPGPLLAVFAFAFQTLEITGNVILFAALIHAYHYYSVIILAIIVLL